MTPPRLRYLTGYPADLLDKVSTLLDEGRLMPVLMQRYPQSHEIRSDRALYAYVQDLKETYLRQSPPLDKVCFDNRLQVMRHALGTHTTHSRVQGNKLKTKREIRIAELFKEAPAPFLRMIVVHELAHLREREHDKAFYALCRHLEPDYHQLEFDFRVYLTGRELGEVDGP